MSEQRMTVYRRADGELVGGEYTTVTGLEWFEDEAREVDRLEIIEEVWQLVSTRTLGLGPTERFCSECDVDLTLPEPVAGLVYCAECEPQSEDQT